MNSLAVGLLSFFFLGYLILGGADIGVGMVLPFLGRTANERRVVIAAIAPFFLGNEVWLVATIGFLTGAFPFLESAVVHGLYPVITLLVVGWVVRDAGLWLRGRIDAARWRTSCDALITVGSWAVALGWGGVLVSLIHGSTDHVESGPVALLAALTVAAVFALHGSAFAAIRLTGAPQSRARFLGRVFGERPLLALTSLSLVALAFGAGLRIVPGNYLADHPAVMFLIPPVAVIAPLLVLSQAWVWWLFRHRVTGPSYL